MFDKRLCVHNLFYGDFPVSRWFLLIIIIAGIKLLSGTAFAKVNIPQFEAVTAAVPTVNGDGIFCELFLGTGGGRAPHPDDIAGRAIDAILLSPRIDFPHPENTVSIGRSFQNFFSDTIYAPDAIRALQPKNFILRGTALLKITNSLDRNTDTPGIDISMRVGSDDGHYLMVGNQYLGNSPDHAFRWYDYNLVFEGEGLYELYLLFAANSAGYSGLELQWMTGTGDWVTLPQSHMYQSFEICENKIFFEEFSEGTYLTDQYAEQGLVFNVLSGDLQITDALPLEFVPVSGDRVFGDPNGFPAEEGQVELLFVDPVTGAPATTNYFSCFVIDSEETGATLTAYGVTGEVVRTVTVNAGGATQEQIEFSAPGIRRIEITLGSGEDTSALDNLCWNIPIITDTISPEDVTSLRTASYENRLVFTWMHSANTFGDLAGYKIYFNGVTEGVVLSSAQNSHEETGLNPSTGYPITVKAYDTNGNESAGVSVTGVTILPNPVNLIATPYTGYVNLAWDSVQPSEYVKHYLVYVSESDFSSVEGMTPKLVTESTTAGVAGLTNNATYFFAVTTVTRRFPIL